MNLGEIHREYKYLSSLLDSVNLRNACLALHKSFITYNSDHQESLGCHYFERKRTFA